MHWFWRVAIAVGAGSVAAFVGLHASEWFVLWMGGPATRPTVAGMVFVCMVLVVPPAVATAVYGHLTRRYYKTRLHVGETRCRKCSYILKGITEPRCPECGERI